MNHEKSLKQIKKNYTHKKKLIELPIDLYEKIEFSAKNNARSVIKEIQFLLENAVG